jgi:hypothetical protein
VVTIDMELWLNLQMLYELENQKDFLGQRLAKEVHVHVKAS